MSDIVEELRARSLQAEQDGEPIALLDEAADEIVRLRKKETECLAAGDLLESQLFSVAKQRDALRLTDEEWEAVDYFAVIHAVDGEPLCNHAVTLRGLLERLGGGR